MSKLFSLLVLIAFISCTSSTASDPGSEGAKKEKSSVKETTAEKERKNPLSYLVQGKFESRRNLIRQWFIEGRIINRASSVSYRNVVINITYHDKNGSQVGKTERTILKLFPAGASQRFQFKLEAPDKTSSLRYTIVAAKPAN